MNFFKPCLNFTLLSLLNWTGLAAPVHATPDNDSIIRAADFAGNLNSGEGFWTMRGAATATDDFEDFRKILLTDRSNLRFNLNRRSNFNAK